MNNTQKAYLKIIHALINVNNIDYMNGNFGYGLSNYIAKFSLAKDNYKISEEALYLIRHNHPNFDFSLRRTAKQTSEFTYEHPVPVSIIRNKLLTLENKTLGEVEHILVNSDYVTIITKLENRELSLNGLRQNFPNNIDWTPAIDPFLRYQTVGITLLDNEVRMEGHIVR